MKIKIGDHVLRLLKLYTCSAPKGNEQAIITFNIDSCYTANPSILPNF